MSTTEKPGKESLTGIWVSSLDTRSFFFEAFGNSEEEARDCLVEGLKAHARQYKLAPDWFGSPDEFNTRAVSLGVAYRDYAPLNS